MIVIPSVRGVLDSFVRFVSENYSLWTWGFNASGQLGFGDKVNRSSVTRLGTLTDWKKVCNANSSTLAIKTNGALWSWGYNGAGQLGLGNSTATSSPVQVGSLTNWDTVHSSSANHVISIKTNGALWTWGSGTYGRLGQGNTTNFSSPVQIGALTTWSKARSALSGSFAIKTDGTLWAWGYNGAGRLGLGDTTNRSSPVQVGSDTNWSDISGHRHTMGIKTDGTLWAWGRNATGDLGLGDTTARSSPVQVGALTTWEQVICGNNCTVAKKTDGTLWSWGYSGAGRLGQGYYTVDRSSPVQIGTSTDWSKIGYSGVGGFVALKTNGTLWGWGAGFGGTFGTGNKYNPTQFGSSDLWGPYISMGNFHVAAIKQYA